MLNNIVEISRNSTELVALLNSSMDAEEKANYDTVLNEMEVQLVSQRRYLVRYCVHTKDRVFLMKRLYLFHSGRH